MYEYKATGVINATPEEYFAFYKDLDYWNQWDDNVESTCTLHGCRVVTHIELEVFGVEADGLVDKIYWSVKYPFPFTNRDYVYKRFAKVRPLQ